MSPLRTPFGRLADRLVRKNMIAGGLAVWSLFSGLTGFAKGFWTMFFCRLMVGVGEATLGPAALSLLSDYFPPRMRATVQGIYSSGIAIGSGLAFFLGGWIGQNFGWRWAFYFLGFPGLALAVVIFFLREQQRGRTEVATVHFSAKDWKILFSSVPLRYLYLGYGLFGIASNNLGIWVPSFFVRVHHMSLGLIGTVAGTLSIVVGVPVTILGGYMSDRFRRFGRGGRMLFSAGLAIASVPLWLALLFNNNLIVLLILNSVLFGLALMWLGPAAADVHDIAGPHLRGQMSETASPAAIQNRILAALPAKEYARLLPHLTAVSLPLGEILYNTQDRIEYVYFPNSGVVSFVAHMKEGASIEVGLAGCEGMVGMPILFGDNFSQNEAIVQIADGAMRMKASVLTEELKRGGELRSVLLRFALALLKQVSQTAACNPTM
ncbi:MAG: MFS transporter [bacterium]